MVFIGVNTPTKRTGLGAGKASDLGWLEAASRHIAKAAVHDTIVVEKSTVPCGTADSIRAVLRANATSGLHFEVLSNPEFLAEGTAIPNLLHPDRILIGSLETEGGFRAAHQLADIYAAWIPREKIITMDLRSSELSKLAANAMLAQRISSINALSSICEAVSANIEDVSHACGLDRRIGPKMLNASVGFGGSCFKKDVMCLVYIAESLHLPEVAAYWKAVVEINEHQKDRFTRRIVRSMHNTLSNKKLAVLGFAYKKDTGDTRESAAITIVNNLLAENATIAIYDPKVQPRQIQQDLNLTPDMHDRVQICSNPYDACQDAHAVVILTEWDMFSNKAPRQSKYSVPSQTSKPSAEQDVQHESHTASENPPTDTTPNTPSEIGSPSLTPSAEIDEVNTDGSDSISDRSSTASVSRSSISSFSKDADGAPPTSIKDKAGGERLDWRSVSQLMQRPMYVFDGRNVVDAGRLESLGFCVESIGVASASMSPASNSMDGF